MSTSEKDERGVKLYVLYGTSFTVIVEFAKFCFAVLVGGGN